jgi:hypothetical protein
MTRQKLITEVMKLRVEGNLADCEFCRRYSGWIEDLEHHGDSVTKQTIELVFSNLRQHINTRHP